MINMIKERLQSRLSRQISPIICPPVPLMPSQPVARELYFDGSHRQERVTRCRFVEYSPTRFPLFARSFLGMYLPVFGQCRPAGSVEPPPLQPRLLIALSCCFADVFCTVVYVVQRVGRRWLLSLVVGSNRVSDSEQWSQPCRARRCQTHSLF
jgi:hypothetical protein